jgi:HSP20 family protein
MTPQTATVMQPMKTPAAVKQTESQQIFNRMHEVFDAIEKRAFELSDSGRKIGQHLSDWLQAESEILHPLHLEIAETDETLTVRAEVPGFTAEELDINVQGKRLTIAGRQESKEDATKGKTIYSEHCAKEIFRSVDLPSDVDGANVDATLKDGVLSIKLPKAAHAKSVRVQPKAAS